MSTTLATTTITRTRKTTVTRPGQAPVRGIPETPAEATTIGNRPASELTRLVFCVILGIAACVALVGVVDQASTTSPDDPPPAVIVDFD